MSLKTEYSVSKSQTTLIKSTKYLALFKILAIFVLMLFMMRLMWLGDDALITLRTALNQSHGWGSGFNFAENVQSYTHPLWFLSWLLLGSLTGEWIFTVFLLSLAVSLLAAGILVWSCRYYYQVFLVFIVLLTSNAFMEYTSSGLETPMVWLFSLLVATLVYRIRQSTNGFQTSFHLIIWGGLLGLSAAGALLTRQDSVLAIFPVFLLGIYYLLRLQPVAVLGLLAGFFLPLAIWFSWAYVTYSSFLPNTFLAKTNLDIPQSEVLIQGTRYFWVAAEFDPVTFLLLTVGAVTVLIFGTLFTRALIIGSLLYLAYLLYIGGDFMAGRFLGLPLVLTTLALIYTSLEKFPNPAKSIKWSLPISATGAVIILIGIGNIPLSLSPAIEPRWQDQARGNIYDTRAKFNTLGKSFDQLFFSPGDIPHSDVFSDVPSVDATLPLKNVRRAANAWPDFSEELLKMSDWPNSAGEFVLLPDDIGVTCGLLGESGILTGPSVHWIDTCALTDRFLANQPFRGENLNWLVGHYVREIPTGYENAVREADPAELEDPRLSSELRSLWTKIRPDRFWRR